MATPEVQEALDHVWASLGRAALEGAQSEEGDAFISGLMARFSRLFADALAESLVNDVLPRRAVRSRPRSARGEAIARRNREPHSGHRRGCASRSVGGAPDRARSRGSSVHRRGAALA